MRIKENELKTIIEVFDSFVHCPAQASLYLFGSRVDDLKKGGDIDLLLVTEAAILDEVKSKRYKISSDIQAKMGEQRIDITIVSYSNSLLDEFVQSILPRAVLLKKW